MGRRPIGDVAMTAAQRQQQYPDKAKALRESAVKPVSVTPPTT
jgi:hypothetical protein